MAFYFTLSCLRSCVLLGCNCMYVYLATNTRKEILIEEQKKMEERYNELGKTLEKLNKKIEHYEQDHS